MKMMKRRGWRGLNWSMLLRCPQSRRLVLSRCRRARIHLRTRSGQLTITINPSQVKGPQDYCRAFQSTHLTPTDKSDIHEKHIRGNRNAARLELFCTNVNSELQSFKMNSIDGKHGVFIFTLWLSPVA